MNEICKIAVISSKSVASNIANKRIWFFDEMELCIELLYIILCDMYYMSIKIFDVKFSYIRINAKWIISYCTIHHDTTRTQCINKIIFDMKCHKVKAQKVWIWNVCTLNVLARRYTQTVWFYYDWIPLLYLHIFWHRAIIEWINK